VLLAREQVAPVPVERARDVVGAGARAMIQRGMALDGRSIETATLDRLFVDFLDHYALNLAVKTQLFPGVEAALDRLAAAGYRLAVCTNKAESSARALLDALGMTGRFAAIYGGDTLGRERAKPAPDVYRLAARSLGVDPTRCAVVEDTPTGTTAGVAAGSRVLGFCAHTDPRALLADGAVAVFDDMQHLPALLGL
jgi:phosphoglycolate phosphatase